MLMAPPVHRDDGLRTVPAGSMSTGAPRARNAWSECREARAPRDKGGLMRPRAGIAAFVIVAGVAGTLAAAGTGAQASTSARPRPGDQGTRLVPGDLLVTTSTYVNDPDIVAGT